MTVELKCVCVYRQTSPHGFGVKVPQVISCQWCQYRAACAVAVGPRAPKGPSTTQRKPGWASMCNRWASKWLEQPVKLCSTLLITYTNHTDLQALHISFIQCWGCRLWCKDQSARVWDHDSSVLTFCSYLLCYGYTCEFVHEFHVCASTACALEPVAIALHHCPPRPRLHFSWVI